MKIYVEAVTRTGAQLTVSYHVREDDSTVVSATRSVSASGDRATVPALKQLAFSDATRFDAAIAAEAALQGLVGTLNVPNSDFKVQVNSVARQVNEPTLEVNFEVLNASDVTVYGPTAYPLSEPHELTNEYVKARAFVLARNVEVAVATEGTLNNAVGQEVTVE